MPTTRDCDQIRYDTVAPSVAGRSIALLGSSTTLDHPDHIRMPAPNWIRSCRQSRTNANRYRHRTMVLLHAPSCLTLGFDWTDRLISLYRTTNPLLFALLLSLSSLHGTFHGTLPRKTAPKPTQVVQHPKDSLRDRRYLGIVASVRSFLRPNRSTDPLPHSRIGTDPSGIDRYQLRLFGF